MIFGKSKRDKLQTTIEKNYEAGLILHRSGDFHERAQTVVISSTPVQIVADRIHEYLPDSASITMLVQTGGAIIYLFTDNWKAAIQLEWINEEVSYYRYWFAQPLKIRDPEVKLSMNIALTAIEKAFLSLKNDAIVIVTYASTAERDFDIGPQKASSNLPDIVPMLNADSFIGAAMDLASDMTLSSLKGLSMEISIKVVSEYLAERKSEKKLGSVVAQDYLASRFLGRPACIEGVNELFEEMKKEKLKRIRELKRFCRKCGQPLKPDALYCGNCGTAIMFEEC